MIEKEYLEYEQDVREAQIAFPELEMRAAYVKFMQEVKKKEPQKKMSTGDRHLEAVKASIRGTFCRPCNQDGCRGRQVLQGVCEGCAAGKKGFKSLWECEECLYREYSRKSYLELYNELTGGK